MPISALELTRDTRLCLVEDQDFHKTKGFGDHE